MSCKMIDALCDLEPLGSAEFIRGAFEPELPLDIEKCVDVLVKMGRTKTVTNGNRTWLEKNAK